MMSKTFLSSAGAFVVLATAPAALAATFYVDNSLPAKGTHDGKSWATAWLSPIDVTGVQPGDVVSISGGPSGSTQSYRDVVTPGSFGDDWHPAGGSPGNPVIYQIGQDPAHNGTVIFDGKGASYWLGYPDYGTNTNVHDVVISGDAGDGKRHFSVSNYGLPIEGDMAQNLRVSYVDFGQCHDGPVRLIPSNGGVEIDHCYAYIADLDADHFSQATFNGTGFDQNSAHDNEIYLPNAAGTGDGADGFQWGGSGFSIYNNTIVGYATAYTGGQHQDGMQPLGASYVKIYGNTIINMGNSAIFLDGYGGDFTHVWVYDNLVIGGGFGITAGPDSGAIDGMGRWPNFTDVVIANNTTADTWNIEAGVSMGIDPYIEQSQNVVVTTVFTDCVGSNNVVVNAAGVSFDSPIVSAGNVSIAAADAPSHFVSYAPNAATNDFHLLATDTTLRGQGANLSQYFSTDHDGNARPASGAWDIGAYQYCGDKCMPSAGGPGVVTGTPPNRASGCGCRIGPAQAHPLGALPVVLVLLWARRRRVGPGDAG
jgi:MYXO-CTERM domain-containing protein